MFILLRVSKEDQDREVKAEAKDHRYVFHLLASNYFDSTFKNQLELLSAITSLKFFVTCNLLIFCS